MLDITFHVRTPSWPIVAEVVSDSSMAPIVQMPCSQL